MEALTQSILYRDTNAVVVFGIKNFVGGRPRPSSS